MDVRRVTDSRLDGPVHVAVKSAGQRYGGNIPRAGQSPGLSKVDRYGVRRACVHYLKRVWRIPAGLVGDDVDRHRLRHCGQLAEPNNRLLQIVENSLAQAADDTDRLLSAPISLIHVKAEPDPRAESFPQLCD